MEKPMNRPMVASILALALCACEQKSIENPPSDVPTAQTEGADRFASLVVDTSEPAAPDESPPPVSDIVASDIVAKNVDAVDSEDGEELQGSNRTAEAVRATVKKVAQDPGLLAGDALRGTGAKISGNMARGSLGGLGTRGVGKGGGGEGFGRVGGLGEVEHGGGRGTGGKIGRGAARSGVTNTGYGHGAFGGVAVHAPIYETSTPESYQNYGTNKFTDPSKDKLSTFSIDVDTGSYTIARRKLNEGALPPSEAVRVEEFINYFKYSYPSPKTAPFAVNLEAAPSPFSAKPNMFVMRVGVQAQKLDEASRKPVHLTFLVDVSGSMNSSDKLALAQRSMAYLVDNLREQDTVAIATYAGRVSQILAPTHASDREKILGAIDKLRSGGSTGMSDGLEAAYQLAAQTLERDEVSRVIVLSDGDANVGATSHDEILSRIKGYVEKGVTLSTIGFGMGNYKDTMMEQLANKGNGNYYYIDDFKEAQRIFGEQLDGTLQVVAKDVKIQVEFDPAEVVAYRLIGYENRDIADKDFRNDKVDAGEIGAGHTVTALYEVELRTSEPSEFAKIRLRHKMPTEDVAKEATFPIRAATFRKTVGDASGDFQFAVAVAGFAEILRRSTYAENLTYDLILEVANPHVGRDPGRKEFLGLVKKAKGLDTKSRVN
jgi:Ca-activated chloride channel family protein